MNFCDRIDGIVSILSIITTCLAVVGLSNFFEPVNNTDISAIVLYISLTTLLIECIRVLHYATLHSQFSSYTRAIVLIFSISIQLLIFVPRSLLLFTLMNANNSVNVVYFKGTYAFYVSSSVIMFLWSLYAILIDCVSHPNSLIRENIYPRDREPNQMSSGLSEEEIDEIVLIKVCVLNVPYQDMTERESPSVITLF